MCTQKVLSRTLNNRSLFIKIWSISSITVQAHLLHSHYWPHQTIPDVCQSVEWRTFSYCPLGQNNARYYMIPGLKYSLFREQLQIRGGICFSTFFNQVSVLVNASMKCFCLRHLALLMLLLPANTISVWDIIHVNSMAFKIQILNAAHNVSCNLFVAAPSWTVLSNTERAAL